MGYKVTKYFTDLQDNNHPYEAGDTFPRGGLKVSPERIAGLLGNENGQGEPVIAEAEETVKTEAAPKKAAQKTARKE